MGLPFSHFIQGFPTPESRSAIVSPPRLRTSWGAFPALPAVGLGQALYGALPDCMAPAGPADPCAQGGFRGAFYSGVPGLRDRPIFYGGHRKGVIGDHHCQNGHKSLKCKDFEWLPSGVILGDGKGDISLSH